jgi:very-short-patch-repair endonuclease
MAFKRPKLTLTYIKAYPDSGRTRIKIPQPITRPLDIHGTNLLKKEELLNEPWWMTIHKKGVRRPRVGEDPLEARAVSKYVVKGTLPERILYKALTDQFHWVDGIQFNFQSSQSGGRLELGGLVADFLFYEMKMIIQVQGPTHTEYLRIRKDDEQKAILEDMGYRVFDIDEELVYNEYGFNDWLRRVFNLNLGTGAGGIFNERISDEEEETSDETLTNSIYNLLLDASSILRRRAS